MNRLAREKSPYLLQHAGNPVDWYPWGEEAFAAARERDVPVFLSVGYSACHWCHVMERESFSDGDVARLLNAAFVAVKVDREELPAVDHLHMAYCQGMTGHGGWPLTVVLTPAGKPFFAGTYFPKEAVPGRPGLVDLLPRLAAVWGERREEVERTAAGIEAALAGQLRRAPAEPSWADARREAVDELERLYDPRRGGFGGAPKFPVAPWLLLLLRQAARAGDGRARAMAVGTLRAMRLGGVYDQLGFGFHRYATDTEWLVPHFEKMLYDQALLALAYLEAAELTGEAGFRRTAEEIFGYVLRDLRAPEGGFAAAEDADSEGEEGRFYLWTTDEVAELLGDGAAPFLVAFNLRRSGNFPAEEGAPHGRNILHRLGPGAPDAAGLALLPEGLGPDLEEARRRLLEARGRRVRPARDDKVLADWNGLMIAALARGAALLGEPRYAAEAARAADFVLGRLRDGAGRLLHRYRDGEAGCPATLDDHAFLAWGCLELHAASGEARWLGEARRLAGAMTSLFGDAEGGYFFAAADPLLPLRQKIATDASLPSGNAVAVEVLVRLGSLTGEAGYEREARAVLRGCGGDAARSPLGCAGLVAAAMLLEGNVPPA